MKLFVTAILLFLATGSDHALAGRNDGQIKDGLNRIIPGDGDYLVILHGWTTGYDNMRVARAHFHDAGFHVVGLRYPTRTAGPDDLLKNHIIPGIAKHCTDPSRKIHFLTHSLGGLLLRDYLQNNRPVNLGRVVMLAPPNKGIEIVDRLAERRAFARFFGPTALKLHTGENSWPNRLGKADFPLGIIMGNSRMPYTSRVLPGNDDGIVSRASGKLEGMKQLIQLSGFHTSLPVQAEALIQAQHFIEGEAFAKIEADADQTGGIVQRWKKFRLRKR
jgi:triacylglycerol lipase